VSGSGCDQKSLGNPSKVRRENVKTMEGTQGRPTTCARTWNGETVLLTAEMQTAVAKKPVTLKTPPTSQARMKSGLA
jgi:hypothetical protein